ncbi:MAG TPA: HD-GYP domain-containing protein [Blastocatellia bacterium]|nr:HD-GYP domain-containing protein [Blastocatellia bacterium]
MATTDYPAAHAARVRLANLLYTEVQDKAGEECPADFTPPDSTPPCVRHNAFRHDSSHDKPAFSDPPDNACLIPETAEPPEWVDEEEFLSDDQGRSLETTIEFPGLPVGSLISLSQFNYISGQLSECATRDELFETLQSALTFVFPTAGISFSSDAQFEQPEANVHSFVLPLAAGSRVHGWCRISRRECGFRGEETDFLRATVQQAGVRLEVIRLTEERQRAFDRMIKALALTLDARDEMTAGHSARVANYSVATARHLGLSAADQKLVYYAALLHDYGKIGVRDEVLCKPAELTPEEYEHIRQHSYYTFRILSRINFGEEMSEIPLIASSHHERPDGRGYPRGLRDTEIHIGARIIAVTDFFDALTAVRHYRQPMSPDEVLQLIEAGRDTQFDGAVIDAFRRYYEEEYRPRRLRRQQHSEASTQPPVNQVVHQS